MVVVDTTAVVVVVVTTAVVVVVVGTATVVVVVVEAAVVVVDEGAGQELALYPLEPAITTWKFWQYCPSLCSSAVETTSDQ